MFHPVVNSLYIDSYRNFSNFKIDFHEKINVLVGANGIGKSTIISLISSLYSEGYYSFFDRESINPDSFACYTLKKIKFTKKLSEELLDEKIFKYPIEGSYIETIRKIVNNVTSVRNTKLYTDTSEFVDREVIPVVSIHYKGIGRSSYFVSNNYLYEVSFTSYLREISKDIVADFSSQHFVSQVTRKVEEEPEVLGIFDSFMGNLTKKLNNVMKLKSQKIVYEEKPVMSFKLLNSKGLSLDKLSSGEAQLEKLIFFSRALSKNLYSVMLLDEPELHLNYGQMLIFSEIVNEAIKNDSQVFIATHSPFFLKTSNSIYIKFLSYDQDNRPQISPINTTELRKIINHPELFFSRKVVLVEDTADKIFFERSLSVINKEKNKNSFFKNNVEFIDAHGKSGFCKIVKFCKNHNIAYKIITDFDFLKKSSDFSYLQFEDIQIIKDKLSTISIQNYSSTLLKKLNKSDLEKLIEILSLVFEKHRDPQSLHDIYFEIKQKIVINEVSIANFFDLRRLRLLYEIFKKGKTWILQDGSVDDYVKDSLKSNGKLSLEKLNDVFYPETVKELNKFVPTTSLRELSKLSDFVY